MNQELVGVISPLRTALRGSGCRRTPSPSTNKWGKRPRPAGSLSGQMPPSFSSDLLPTAPSIRCTPRTFPPTSSARPACSYRWRSGPWLSERSRTHRRAFPDPHSARRSTRHQFLSTTRRQVCRARLRGGLNRIRVRLPARVERLFLINRRRPSTNGRRGASSASEESDGERELLIVQSGATVRDREGEQLFG